MNKSEIADRLAGRTGWSKAADGAVDAVFETIGAALARGTTVSYPYLSAR